MLTTNLFTNDFFLHLYSTPLPGKTRQSSRIARSPNRNVATGSDNPRGLRKWWSRTGSNRRHPACKAGALPAELRPLIVVPDMVIKEMVGLGGLEPPTSRLSSARSNQLSYKPDEASSSGLQPNGAKPRRKKEGKRGRRQGAICSERRCWDCS